MERRGLSDVGATARTFYVIDFDRTLGNTERLFEAFTALLERQHPMIYEAITRQKQQVEQSGGSYDVMAGLVEGMSDDESRQLLAVFVKKVQEAADGFLYDGAQSFLQSLSKKGAHAFGIVTRGGEAWQSAKLAAVGFDRYPVLVMSPAHTQTKGELVATWKQGARYHLPDLFGGVFVDRVVLVDDKPSELIGLPDDGTAVAVCIQHQQPGRGHMTAGSVLPDHLRIVTSLRDMNSV